MAFTLHRAPDSMTILDNRGAKNLLCDGDLIFYRG
jgi:DNA segregation ATPase FtsK/SpoIIIE-like protein